MKVEFAAAAKYIGELYAVATHDAQIADPADVDMHGVPIAEWRRAYLEGCKDMAEGIVARIADADREKIKTLVIETATQERKRLEGELVKVRESDG